MSGERSEDPEGGTEPARPYRTPFRRAPNNPWWIAPFLGRVPDIPPAKIQMLGVIALAILFENYDQAMLTAAAVQLAESFGLAHSRLAALLLLSMGCAPAHDTADPDLRPNIIFIVTDDQRIDMLGTVNP